MLKLYVLLINFTASALGSRGTWCEHKKRVGGLRVLRSIFTWDRPDSTRLVNWWNRRRTLAVEKFVDSAIKCSESEWWWKCCLHSASTAAWRAINVTIYRKMYNDTLTHAHPQTRARARTHAHTQFYDRMKHERPSSYMQLITWCHVRWRQWMESAPLDCINRRWNRQAEGSLSPTCMGPSN